MSDLKFETVERALNWLESQEPEEILEVLEDYPGVRHSVDECVLARYCKETTGKDVRVGAYGVSIVEKMVQHPFCPLGKKLCSFRAKFDDGDYPQLEL